jgi:DNA repair photolyase
MTAIRTSTRAGVAAIGNIIAWPQSASTEWAKGFLSGIFDAEGSYSRGVLRICNTDPAIIDQVGTCLRRLGFSYAIEERPRQTKPIRVVRLLGGLREHLRFFHTVDPSITRKRIIDGVAIKSDARLRVVAVEPLGVELPLYDITTGTGDFIANGVVSHNCFARPSHTYLNFNAGVDFETKVVVKVNAPEVLRRELRRPSWRGDHVAMGTNTDPYQRCEGRYGLTRAVLEVLRDHRNPCSILTKSPLLVRDLDLFVDLHEQAGFAANLSIGTLDEDVWRRSEPGTPHPKARMAAVKAIRQAGIPCGVLVAPVLPGLSDSPEQLDAVVKACVEAGAVSITPILLHLRAGVREHYLGWLAGARPDLLDRYAELYPRAYAATKTQDELSALVKRLVARHGGRTVAPRETRAVSTKKAARAPEPSQLRLV